VDFDVIMPIKSFHNLTNVSTPESFYPLARQRRAPNTISF